MDKYSRMVESIKENNKEVFREIYSLLDSQQIRQPVRQLCANTSEFKPDFNLRPAPLTFNSSLIEIHKFYDQFSKYINSSNSAPEGTIYAQAGVNMDRFWLTGWEASCTVWRKTNNRGPIRLPRYTDSTYRIHWLDKTYPWDSCLPFLHTRRKMQYQQTNLRKVFGGRGKRFKQA